MAAYVWDFLRECPGPEFDGKVAQRIPDAATRDWAVAERLPHVIPGGSTAPKDRLISLSEAQRAAAGLGRGEFAALASEMRQAEATTFDATFTAVHPSKFALATPFARDGPETYVRGALQPGDGLWVPRGWWLCITGGQMIVTR